MELRKQGIASGAAIIDGYNWNGNFVPADAIPNYVYWEYPGNEEVATDQLGFVNNSNFELELVSLFGGWSVGGQTDDIEVTLIMATLKAQNPNNFPDNFISLFTPNANLPYSFPKGLILPIGAKVTIAFSAIVSYLRCIAKPCLPVFLGPITRTP